MSGFFECTTISIYPAQLDEKFDAKNSRLVPLQQNKKLKVSARDRTRTCCVEGASLTTWLQSLTYETISNSTLIKSI